MTGKQPCFSCLTVSNLTVFGRRWGTRATEWKMYQLCSVASYDSTQYLFNGLRRVKEARSDEAPVVVSFYPMTLISASPVWHNTLLPASVCTWISLQWHWGEPSRIDWTTTCSPVCQPWIIRNDIQSISGGLAACISFGKWTAQSKEALEKPAITAGGALTQNTVPLTPVAAFPWKPVNGRSGCWIHCELWVSVYLPPPLLPSLLLFNRAMLHSEGHLILVWRQRHLPSSALRVT